MENKLEITVGDGDHEPEGTRNVLPVKMELCADSRKGTCQYYVGVLVETEHVSFQQGFCVWKHKKSPRRKS